MPLLSSNTSNMMANLLGSLPQGQRMSFAGTLAQGLAAGNQTSDYQAQRSAAERDALRRSRELELALLEYQADTLAYGSAQAKKEKETAELRKQVPQNLQELFDVDQERAVAQAFPDPISPYQQATLDQGAQTENRLERGLAHTIGSDDRTADRLEADQQRQLAQDEFTGTLQTEAAKRDQARLELEQGKADEPDDFTKEVARLAAANPEKASTEEGMRDLMNVALGTRQSATDPVLGGTMTYNLATNEAERVEPPAVPAPRLPAPTDASGKPAQPFTAEEMAQEIGAWPFAEDVVARTLGQVNPELVDVQRARAATQLSLLKQRGLVALSSSARPLAAEVKNIFEAIPSKGIFDSAARAQATFGQLRTVAVQQHNDYADMIESGSIDEKLAKELRRKQFEIRQFIQLIPPDAPDTGAPPDPTGGTGARGATPDQLGDPDPLGLR